MEDELAEEPDPLRMPPADKRTRVPSTRVLAFDLSR